MWAGYGLQDYFDQHNRRFLQTAAQSVHGRVLSESAGAQRIFREAGRELMPLWSPELAFLFRDESVKNPVSRLNELGYTHILLTRAQSSINFLEHTGALRRLNGHLKGVMANDTFALFVLVPDSAGGAKNHD